MDNDNQMSRNVWDEIIYPGNHVGKSVPDIAPIPYFFRLKIAKLKKNPQWHLDFQFPNHCPTTREKMWAPQEFLFFTFLHTMNAKEEHMIICIFYLFPQMIANWKKKKGWYESFFVFQITTSNTLKLK